MASSEPSSMQRPPRRPRWLAWSALLLLCGAVRLTVVWIGFDDLRSDPDAYRILAANWHDTGTFGRLDEAGLAQPTAYRPPLYPWLLSWWSSRSDADAGRAWTAGMHMLLGLFTCGLTARIGRLLGLPSVACGLAALSVAIDPILVRQSMLIMTETTATFLGMLIWWFSFPAPGVRQQAVRGLGPIANLRSANLRSAILGMLWGLAILCRPTFLAWVVLWVLAMACRAWKTGGRLGRSQGLVLIGCVVGLCLVLGPWTLRNARELGIATPTTTHGGYTLYLANNPILYDHWRTSFSREWDEEAFHARWLKEREAAAVSGEVAVDTLAQRLAWHTIGSEPLAFLRGSVIRCGWFWALWPSERQASLLVQCVIGTWYGMILTVAVWTLFGSLGGRAFGSARTGASDSRRNPCNGRSHEPASRFWGWLPGGLLILSLMLVHSVYWSNMRMRAPAIPVVNLIAVCGLSSLFRKKDPDCAECMAPILGNDRSPKVNPKGKGILDITSRNLTI